MELFFSKYQGAGNDFVLIDARKELGFELNKELIARLCDRRFGIGADGLMTLETDALGSDFYMRYFNADGGESTMCGNGGRSIVRFADDLSIGGRLKNFRAVDGAHQAKINSDRTITISMVDVECVERRGGDFFLNTGSPHYVIFGGQYDENIAREIRLRDNCNVNFVNVEPDGALSIRTFERGVEAETWACGTGATAAALAAFDAELLCCRPVGLRALGGGLSVDFERDGGRFCNITLTGGAEKVFSGSLNIEIL